MLNLVSMLDIQISDSLVEEMIVLDMVHLHPALAVVVVEDVVKVVEEIIVARLA